MREDSSSLTFGIIEDMLSQNKELFTDSDKKIGQYIDFMKEVSGFSLGSIVLFNFCHIRDFQYLLNFIPDWKSKWLCIGKIMSEPIGINKEDGNVYWFSEIPYNDAQAEPTDEQKPWPNELDRCQIPDCSWTDGKKSQSAIV